MTINTKEKCAQELADRHGRQVSHRFGKMLENREQSEGKTLTDEEIQNFKIQFETEIYRELLMKGCK
jgi:hypothetical protein